MYSNEIFMAMAKAQSEQTKTRLKGYYVCPLGEGGCGTDFIKANAQKRTTCPFCGASAIRIKYMNDVDVRIAISIWKDAGNYNPLKADLKQAGKEVLAS